MPRNPVMDILASCLRISITALGHFHKCSTSCFSSHLSIYSVSQSDADCKFFRPFQLSSSFCHHPQLCLSFSYIYIVILASSSSSNVTITALIKLTLSIIITLPSTLGHPASASGLLLFLTPAWSGQQIHVKTFYLRCFQKSKQSTPFSA